MENENGWHPFLSDCNTCADVKLVVLLVVPFIMW